jgi:long-chain acyl-CoA synthetase
MICEPFVIDLLEVGLGEESVARADPALWIREVKQALHHHPAIGESVALVVPHPAHGEEVVAFVTLRGKLAGWEQELRDWVRRLLGDYKTPQRIIIVPEIPKTPAGRVDGKALEDLISSLHKGLDFVGS